MQLFSSFFCFIGIIFGFKTEMLQRLVSNREEMRKCDLETVPTKKLCALINSSYSSQQLIASLPDKLSVWSNFSKSPFLIAFKSGPTFCSLN